MIRMIDKIGTNVTTIVPRRMISKKGTTKKKAMLSVDKISRIPVVPLSWKSAHCAWHGDVDDERRDGHDDECPKGICIHQLGRTSPADRLTLHRAGDFLPSSGQVPNAISGGI